MALVLVFAFSVSWIWTSLGLMLRSPQPVTVLSIAVQFPLTFASNVFVSPATMPGWLRAFVDANPVSHLVTAERALMDGTAAAGQAGWVLLIVLTATETRSCGLTVAGKLTRALSSRS